MGTALIYLLVVAAVAAAVFGLAAVVFGRGEELAPLAPGVTPTRLPRGDVSGQDVRELRFQQALRGYRMDEVDWVLDRLAVELDRAEVQRDGLLARVAQLEGQRPGPARPEPAQPESPQPESQLPEPQHSDPQRPDSRQSGSQHSGSQHSESQGSDSQGSESQRSDSQRSESQGSDSQRSGASARTEGEA